MRRNKHAQNMCPPPLPTCKTVKARFLGQGGGRGGGPSVQQMVDVVAGGGRSPMPSDGFLPTTDLWESDSAGEGSGEEPPPPGKKAQPSGRRRLQVVDSEEQDAEGEPLADLPGAAERRDGGGGLALSPIGEDKGSGAPVDNWIHPPREKKPAYIFVIVSRSCRAALHTDTVLHAMQGYVRNFRVTVSRLSLLSWHPIHHDILLSRRQTF